MRGGFSFSCEVGGQNDLLHEPIGHPVKQYLQAYVVGANAVKGTELAHEHKVQTLVGTRSFHGRLVCWRLHHTQFGCIAFGIQTCGANVDLRQCVAQLAMTHVFGSFLQSTRQRLRPRTVMLQQVKRHARGRLDSHARQTAQGLDQRVNRLVICHATSKRKLHATGQARHTGREFAHFF